MEHSASRLSFIRFVRNVGGSVLGDEAWLHTGRRLCARLACRWQHVAWQFVVCQQRHCARRRWQQHSHATPRNAVRLFPKYVSIVFLALYFFFAALYASKHCTGIVRQRIWICICRARDCLISMRIEASCCDTAFDRASKQFKAGVRCCCAMPI